MRHRDQEASAGLRIIEDILQLPADLLRSPYAFLRIIPVPVGSGRNQAHPRALQSFRMEGYPVCIDMDRYAAALGHLIAVSQQGKTGHVRTAVHRIFYHDIPCFFVQGLHLQADPFQDRRLRHLGFCGCHQNPDPKRLCQNQVISRSGAAVCQNPVRMHKSGHGQAVKRLRSVDRMSAGNDRSRLIGFLITATKNLLYGMGVHLLRNAHQIKRQLRLPSHGIDVAQRIGCRNLAVHKRIIHDRRKKVRRLHQGQLIVQPVDAGVVALVKTHDQVRIGPCPEAIQQADERPCPDFCPASGTAGKFCKPYLCLHTSSFRPYMLSPVRRADCVITAGRKASVFMIRGLRTGAAGRISSPRPGISGYSRSRQPLRSVLAPPALPRREENPPPPHSGRRFRSWS